MIFDIIIIIIFIFIYMFVKYNIEVTQLNCIWTEVLQIIIIFVVLKKNIYFYYFIHNENIIFIAHIYSLHN